MLLDIRGVYKQSDRVQAPTLRRLKMTERALRSGNTFPTNHYFVTDNLWQAFQDATRQRRVAFAGMWNLFIHACAEEHTTSLRFKSHGEGDTDMPSECMLHLE